MSRLKKHYIVYETTNKINGMTYIGCHGTYNLEDGYIGSGIYSDEYASYRQEYNSKHGRNSHFIDAVCEFGYHNFVTKTLSTFDNHEDALEFESQIADKKFVSLSSNYNIAIGGRGGIGGWNRAPEIDVHQAYDLYMRGMTYQQVAETIGSTKRVVFKRLKHLDKVGRLRGAQIDNKLAHKLYMDGMSADKVAEYIGSTVKIVRNRLKAMDTSGRKLSREHPIKEEALQWFADNYEHYQSLYSSGRISKKQINDCCPCNIYTYGFHKEFTKEKASA